MPSFDIFCCKLGIALGLIPILTGLYIIFPFVIDIAVGCDSIMWLTVKHLYVVTWQHGSDSQQPLRYTHLDIAASSGPFPGVPTGSPLVAMAHAFVLNRESCAN